jgi:carboxymethylenebutenolidase
VPHDVFNGIPATIFNISKLVTPMNRIPRYAAGLLTFLWLGTAVAEAQEVQVQEAVHQYRSGETRVTVECFAPAAEGKFPAVLLLHGSGGLEQSTGDIFREFARGLSSEGYVVLIPHYFEATAHVVGKPFGSKDIPAYVEAVQDAIEFAVASGVVDSERIGVVGWSMGAYLAFFRSARDPRIKAMVSISGSLPVESKSKFPPVLILQGSKDSSSPAQRLKDFQEKLKAENSPVVSHVYRGVGHNLDLPTWDDVSRRTAVFFNKYLKKHEPRRTKSSPKKRMSHG